MSEAGINSAVNNNIFNSLEKNNTASMHETFVYQAGTY